MVPMLQDRFSSGLVWGDDTTYHGRAMLSHHSIEVEVVESVFRPALRCRLNVGGEPVDVIGVHLANPVNFRGAVTARRAQVASVLGLLAEGDGRAVVAGDFNATPMWPAYRALRASLHDGVRDSDRTERRRSKRTWAPRPGWPGMLRIDHMFVKGVELTEVEVSPVIGSDHRAVTATLKLRDHD